MIASQLVLALLLASPPDPAELVARLGAPSFAERERATAGLRDLGDAALPALRAALRDKDAEVRARAATLAGEIETGRLLRPTPIALNYKDRTLADVLKDFGAQAKVEVVLQPMGVPDNAAGRRVTLEVPGTVPFWTAADRLAAAAQLQHNATMFWGPPTGRPTFTFWQGAGSAGGRIADSGPFRVVLQNIQHNRSVSLNQPGAAGEAVNDQFSAQLMVVPEPRIALFSQTGPVKIVEAVDDLGQSIAMPEAGSNHSGQIFFHNQGNRFLSCQAMLIYPARPGKRIKALRGNVPVMVASRRDEPLVVRLAEAAGKTFRVDDGSLTIQKVGDPDQGPILEAVLQGADEVGMNPGHERFQGAQSRLEILDAQGRALPLHINGGWSAGQANLTVIRGGGQGETGPPVEFRYYGLNRANTTVPFEFNDLPMP